MSASNFGPPIVPPRLLPPPSETLQKLPTAAELEEALQAGEARSSRRPVAVVTAAIAVGVAGMVVLGGGDDPQINAEFISSATTPNSGPPIIDMPRLNDDMTLTTRPTITVAPTTTLVPATTPAPTVTEAPATTPPPPTTLSPEQVEAQRQAYVEAARAVMEAERPARIGELQPLQILATLSLVQTAPGNADAPAGNYLVEHNVRVGGLSQGYNGAVATDRDFDAGSREALKKGGFFHAEGTALPGIDDLTDPMQPAVVIGLHHLSAVQDEGAFAPDPNRPELSRGLPYPEKTRIRDEVNGVVGDMLNLTLVTGQVLTYEAIGAEELPASLLVNVEHDLVVYSCAQTEEDYANAAPGVNPAASNRDYIYFRLRMVNGVPFETGRYALTSG